MENIINNNNDILELCYKQIISLENILIEAQKNSLKFETPCKWCYCFIFVLFVIIICFVFITYSAD